MDLRNASMHVKFSALSGNLARPFHQLRLVNAEVIFGKREQVERREAVFVRPVPLLGRSLPGGLGRRLPDDRGWDFLAENRGRD